METTGSILKSYMKNRIKRDAYAKILGITPQYLSNILSNKKKASQNLLSKMINSLDISEEDRKKILDYENKRKKLQKIVINKNKLTKEGLKSYGIDEIYSKGGKLINTLTNLSLFVQLEYNIFDFKCGDILIFEKYEDQNIENNICLCDNTLCKVKKVDKSYIIETSEIKIVKKINVEYILVYSIRREHE